MGDWKSGFRLEELGFTTLEKEPFLGAESTIRDVAKYASVSVATVSRVLNDSPVVRAATRQRVLEAIEALHYTPNLIARKLSRGKTHTIAVVLPLFTLPSFVERLRGVHEELTDNGYDLVLYSVETPEQRDDFLDRLSSPSRVDGMLLISLPPSDEQAKRLAASSVPTVLVDASHERLPHIIVDDEEGGYLATRLLIELGHTRIAYLSDFLETPFQQSMRQRYRGYRRALAEAGIEFDAQYHVWDTHGRLEARELARGLMHLDKPPTAIFAASDTQAIGVLDATREMGISVPGSLSVIGFDGIRDSEFLDLTTIEQPLFDSGVQGAARLLSMIQHPEVDRSVEIVLPLRLVERATTGPPPSGGVEAAG